MNVNVDNTLFGGERLGVMYLERGAMMRPSKVIYDRSGSSFSEVQPGMFNWEQIFRNAVWFHWTGITPALSQSAAETCLEAVQCAKKAGLFISCDINYRKNLWKYGVKASEVIPTLVELSDLVIGNEEDFQDVFGIQAENFDVEHTHGEIDVESFRTVCIQMMDLFPKCKCLAMTLRGAINANYNTWQGLLYADQTLYTSKKYELTHIVDRVGGGDAFAGGLICGLLEKNFSWQSALDFAVSASALKHSIYGDFNRVSRDEVFSLMSGDLSGRVKR